MRKDKILAVVTGATASGKTAFSIGLAHKFNTEIVCADSRQIYKGMPVITACPTQSEKQLAKHHLVELLDIETDYNAGKFATDAQSILKSIWDVSSVAIMCGGSNLYVDAVTKGLHDAKAISAITRKRIQELYETSGLEALIAYLEILDNKAVDLIDAKNPRRVAHAIELILTEHKPLSEIYADSQANDENRGFKVIKFAIHHSREKLFGRINHRVDYMMNNGMMDEIEKFYPLRNKGYNALNSIGFNEMFAYKDGYFPLEQAVERMKKNTRVFAKKQLNYLKNESNVIMLPDDIDSAVDIACTKIYEILK